MNMTDAKVRKCKNVSILIDKKTRKRRIEHDKYIIMLDENMPLMIHGKVRSRVRDGKNTLKTSRKMPKSAAESVSVAN